MLTIDAATSLKNYCDAVPSLSLDHSSEIVKIIRIAESFYPWKNVCSASWENVPSVSQIKVTSKDSLDRLLNLPRLDFEGSTEEEEVDLKIVRLFETLGLSKVGIIVFTTFAWTLTLIAILKAIPKSKGF